MIEHKSYWERMRRQGGADAWALAVVADLNFCGPKLKNEQKAILSRLEGFPAREPWFHDLWLTEDERERRDYEQASRMTDKEILDQGLWRSGPMVNALRHHGDYDRAIRLMQSISKERMFASARTWVPNLKLWLALMYVEAGRDAEAAVVLEELSALLEPMVGDGMRNAVTLEQLAETQALQGHGDAAISTLELSEASGNGTVFNCYDPDGVSRVLDPFAALRSNPRFQKLHERCLAEYERQCEVVRARLAERDFDVLLAPLMALAEEEKAKKQAAAVSK